MIESAFHYIDPQKDLPSLNERILRLPDWRRRDTLSYLHPSDRLQSAIACELLAGLLDRCFDIPADRFRIEYDPNGKPAVCGRSDIFISLAHCRKGVMAVVADLPVGCDIEAIQRPYEDNGAVIAYHCFTENELRRIESAPDPATEFTRIWTIKESVFKLDNSLEIESIDTTHLPDVRISSTVTADCVATLTTLRNGAL